MSLVASSVLVIPIYIYPYTRTARKHKRREYRNAGANSSWHVDGYDKLKPFGFPIHGCINGYSHKIIWLKTVRSSNNPFIIGAIFLEHLKQYKVVQIEFALVVVVKTLF